METIAREGLAGRLKQGTNILHDEVERAGIMADFLRGRISRAAYCSLLRNLYDIYEALEAALERNKAHPCLRPIAFPELSRKSALAADLAWLNGELWAEELPVAPGCLRYVERLQEIEAGHAELLVAHAYVRYMGDLNGGRVLRRIVARALALESEDGLGFYAFPVSDLPGLARHYREGLDAIEVDEPTAAAIVAEAQRAFSLHTRLFVELKERASPEDLTPQGTRGQ